MNIFQILCSAIVSILGGMVIIPLLKRTNATQTILHYVKEHDEKNGTPTMGGIIFIIAIVGVSLFCIEERMAGFCLLIAGASGFVGLLDDIAKIKFGKNMGLHPYQKVISQLVLSAVFGYFVFENVGTVLSIPFFKTQIDIGIAIIPLLVIAFIATTNTVNLTDGIDGLCTSSTICALALLSILVYVQMQSGAYDVMSYYQKENFMSLIGISISALIGFLVFNANKASVFMGDVGSLFLGGLVVAMFAVSKNLLYLLVMGLPFVLSGVSDILQVCYFKITKGKRIFLMAPYHHHLQRKGLSENKICVLYSVVTAVVGLIAVCLV